MQEIINKNKHTNKQNKEKRENELKITTQGEKPILINAPKIENKREIGITDYIV